VWQELHNSDALDLTPTQTHSRREVLSQFVIWRRNQSTKHGYRKSFIACLLNTVVQWQELHNSDALDLTPTQTHSRREVLSQLVIWR